MNDPELDESLGSLVLGTELEKLAAQKWLTDQGLPENVTVGAFALHCLRDEGIEADGELANQVLWSCGELCKFDAYGCRKNGSKQSWVATR